MRSLIILAVRFEQAVRHDPPSGARRIVNRQLVELRIPRERAWRVRTVLQLSVTKEVLVVSGELVVKDNGNVVLGKELESQDSPKLTLRVLVYSRT